MALTKVISIPDSSIFAGIRSTPTTADTLKQNYGRVIHVFQTVIPVAVKAAETSAAGKSIYRLICRCTFPMVFTSCVMPFKGR